MNTCNRVSGKSSRSSIFIMVYYGIPRFSIAGEVKMKRVADTVFVILPWLWIRERLLGNDPSDICETFPLVIGKEAENDWGLDLTSFTVWLSQPQIKSVQSTFPIHSQKNIWNVYCHFNQVDKNDGTRMVYITIIISDEVDNFEGNEAEQIEAVKGTWRQLVHDIACCTQCKTYSLAEYHKMVIRNGKFDFLNNKKIGHLFFRLVHNGSFENVCKEISLLPILLGEQ